ncbi:unnamed protein product [Urochloa humidicola]
MAATATGGLEPGRHRTPLQHDHPAQPNLEWRRCLLSLPDDACAHQFLRALGRLRREARRGGSRSAAGIAEQLRWRRSWGWGACGRGARVKEHLPLPAKSTTSPAVAAPGNSHLRAPPVVEPEAEGMRATAPVVVASGPGAPPRASASRCRRSCSSPPSPLLSTGCPPLRPPRTPALLF